MQHPNILGFQSTFNKQIIKGHYSAIMLFVHNDEDPLVKKFEEVAVQNKKQYKHYVISDKTNKSTHLYRDTISGLDIKDSDLPVIIYATHTLNFHFIKYKFDGVINKFNVLHWIDNVKKGLVPEYYKSGTPLTAIEQEEHFVKQ